MPFPTVAQVPTPRIASAVDTVFHNAEYRGLTYQELIWQWMVREIARFFGWIDGLYHQLRSSPILFWVVVTALGLLLIALVARSVWLWHLHRLDVAEGSGWAKGVVAGRYRDPWLAAQELASRGDYTSAAHALYAAMLDRAARDQQVRLHPSKTVGDYVRELRVRSSSLFGRFRDFARTYEVVIYGVGTCDEARYQRLLALAVPVAGPRG